MKVVVVGASHIGALKLGYDQNPGRHAFGMAFFGLAGRSFAAVQANERGIGVDLATLPQPERPRSLWTPIDRIVRYDEAASFVILGKTDTAALVSTAAEGRVRGHSRAYLQDGLCDLVRSDRAFTLAAAVRRLSTRPTVFMTTPMPVNLPPDAITPLVRTDWDLAQSAISRACETGSLLHVPQPEETLADSFATAAIHARGAKRLGGVADRPAEDGTHMNAAYGAIALSALQNLLTRDLHLPSPHRAMIPPAQEPAAHISP